MLAHYESFNHNINGVTFSHSQGSNELNITVSSDTDATNAHFVSKNYGIYELMSNGRKYDSSTMANYVYFQFNNGTIQNLIFSNYIDPSNFNISVEIQSGKIALQKTNNIGNAISDCVFELYRNVECTDLIKTATTGNDGRIIYDKLKPMTYYIKEKSVATGYLLDTSVQRVDVVAGQTANVTFRNNEPTGQIKVYKVSTNNDKIAGAEFEIKANEDIYNVARTKKYYSKGDSIGKITSNSNGIAVINDLPLGKYIVYETKAPKGYLLNETIFNANIEYVNSTTPVVELRIEGVINTEPTGVIEIIKRDCETGSIAQGDATLENAVYKVYANEDIYNVAKSKKYYSKGDLVATRTIEGAKLQVIDENGNIIDKWTSTKEPHIVNGLEENQKYKLVEITSPYGYELTEEIEFVVTTDKETQLVEMKDMPILKDIKVIKIDCKTKEIIKEKFSFGIYEDEECNNLIKEVKSSKVDGYIVFENLRYGTYYIKETKSPSGYELSDKIVKLEINDNGVFVDGTLIEEKDSVYSFEFENTEIEVPNTGDSRYTKILIFIGGISAISLIGIVVYDYKKRKNKV